MKIAVRVGKAAATIALALPVAALPVTAQAQYTGVSHPDDAPITNAPAVPQAYPVQPATTAALKPRPEIPVTPVEPAPVTTASTRMPEPMATRVPEPMLNDGAIPAVPNVDGNVVMRVPGPSNQLPVGTLVMVRLGQEISTKTTASGTTFTAQLVEPVERDGRVLLPVGSTLSGLVTDVHGGRRISGAASIHLRTMWVTLPDGTRYALRGQVIDTDMYKLVKVDDEGTILRKDHAGRTSALTAGTGAAAGAIFGGLPGAVIGAGIGAGVSTAAWLTQDRQTDLPMDTKIAFSLVEPLIVGPE